MNCGDDCDVSINQCRPKTNNIEEIKKNRKIKKVSRSMKKKEYKLKHGKKVSKDNNRVMKIYYINIRGIKSKIRSMEEILKKMKIDVAIFCESLLKKSEKIKIEGYNSFNVNEGSTNEKRGITIMYKKDLSNKISIQECSEECELVRIRLKMGSNENNTDIIICYGVQEGSSKEKLNEFYDQLQKMIENSAKKKIIIGDLNAKIKEGNLNEKESKNGM